jgi:hypothetical protein
LDSRECGWGCERFGRWGTWRSAIPTFRASPSGEEL